jgi:hypothetical protein
MAFDSEDRIGHGIHVANPHSGDAHIFKAFLESVEAVSYWSMNDPTSLGSKRVPILLLNCLLLACFLSTWMWNGWLGIQVT